MEVEAVQNRNTLINKLTTQKEWDLIVIGGGATGLGIALEAVSRGYSALLIEQADFAKGTSSRSTKLVHGGVRYLAQGDIQLVREASIERGLLWRNAPHLVKNQTFIIPIYTWWDRLKYTIGLKLYDWISGTLSLGSSVFISRTKALQKLPNIKTEGLVGGVMYHDGQFDDSRLAINLVQTIIEQGGVALNYTKVTGLIKEDGQHISGVKITDTETNRQFTCKAKAVINATGVFVDAILQMDNPTGSKSITASQGVHLVLDKKFYPANDALMIPATSDGRVLFAVPWHNKVVVGTTDTPVNEASLEPQALEKEIAFILENASRYFVQQPKRSDVLSVFAGLRPLAAPTNDNQKTKEISRSHKIMVTPSHLFTILGGKWTTYRKMGEDMVDRIEKELQWPHKKTATRQLAIHGALTDVNLSDPLYFYGSDTVKVKALMNGHSNEWLSKSLQIHEAQVIWAVRHEMARTVEDVLSRRTRALLLDARESIRMAEPVATIMAKELQKDNNWVQEQVEAYTKLAQGYLLQ
ncbi:glycerol-3-phosphate dehydrogenase/oxidase [Niastella caeni]|uniref:Glycerol-3-phosphate dehydrogenase/oxidase n=1 Tax=Niastella caeni TaxID=2569763 RepID=A0A4S8HSH8_9BACT|nr:glycerol-3-phosphate dehydrogenase/oxidase [Niastella caeni]THU36072.1 glycerol-3-phosphate dehydrogenase/oxidase [Niastella caeni]